MATHGFNVNDDSFQHFYLQSLPTPLPKGTPNLMDSDITTPPFVPLPLPPLPGQYNILPSGPHHGGGGERSTYRGSSGNILASMPRKMKQTRRRKGRPPGSKNKPKGEEALKNVIMEIPAGCDIVAELINFAENNNVVLTVLSGSGSVTNVTLNSHTFPNNEPPSLTNFHGNFTILSLSGTYVTNTQYCSSLNVASSSSSLPPNPSFPVNVPFSPGFSCFATCLQGSQGEIFGGVITGRMIAANLVVVVAALYKKPMIHRVILNDNNETINKSLNNVFDDLSDVNDEVLLNGSKDNDSFLALLASFKDAVRPSSPLNNQAPDHPPHLAS